jgi:hypothetical protein
VSTKPTQYQFVLQQVAGPVRYAVGEALGRRYQGRVHRRVMRAVLGPATLRHLEDPALHDRVRRALPEGGMLTSGAPYRLAALLVVAHFGAPLALLLAAVWLHHLRRLHAVHRGLIAVRRRRTAATRYGEYLGDLTLTAEAAKEVRVFGLGAWLGDRFEGVWAGAIERGRHVAPLPRRGPLGRLGQGRRPGRVLSRLLELALTAGREGQRRVRQGEVGIGRGGRREALGHPGLGGQLPAEGLAVVRRGRRHGRGQREPVVVRERGWHGAPTLPRSGGAAMARRPQRAGTADVRA